MPRHENQYVNMQVELCDAMTKKSTPSGASAMSFEQAIDALSRKFSAFSQYVDQVVRMESRTALAYSQLAGQELRDAVQKEDHDRRSKHLAAIEAVASLNRLCEHYGVHSVLPAIPTSEDGKIDYDTARPIVAAACNDYVVSVFRDRSI